MSRENGVVARAIALAPPYGPSEVRTLIDGADALLARGEPFTRDEHRLLDRADKLRIFFPSIPKPSPVPVELLQAITAAAAACQAAEIASGRRQEQVVEKRLAVFTAKTEDEMHRRTEAALAAERAWADALADRNKTRAKLCDAQLQVEFWRRDQLLREHTR